MSIHITTPSSCVSRHPRIQYWFWDKRLVENKAYYKQLEILASESDFNTVVLSSRDGLSFYDTTLKPHFADAVRSAHEKGFKIIMQLWPHGHKTLATVEVSDATALVTEAEGIVKNGTASLRLRSLHSRDPQFAPPICCKLLKIYAFKKLGEGEYKSGTLIDVTDKANMTVHSPTDVTLDVSLPIYEGYTVYANVAHYYNYADLFSERAIEDFRGIMEQSRDVGFDGFVLDELRNMSIIPPWNIDVFRERFYGDSFKRYFDTHTGRDLDRTLFDMRYCEYGKDNERISAINVYFDTFRHSTKRIEIFMANYNKEVYGKDAFLGLHSTYHNRFQSDELWMTCGNWYEAPRVYAQTDESIGFPIRMGLACQAKESLIYDMFYKKDSRPFIEKLMSEAAFGSRIHYHAMNDAFYGVDTGSRDFLRLIKPYEDKIRLLDAFDPCGLPKMELLIVFGFPALCNWYPDESARSTYDVNAKLYIEKRAKTLWQDGYFNALAPSDALDDGRITLDADGTFDYCGHKFKKLLFLYPQYAKRSTLDALINMASKSTNLFIIGEITKDFDGNPFNGSQFKPITLDENANLPDVLDLKQNTVENGCILEDGSVVISDLTSFEEHFPKQVQLEINDHLFETAYEGVLAIKTDRCGKIEKLVCGECKFVKRDGEIIYQSSTPSDIIIFED